MAEKTQKKNIKISDRHHDLLIKYCDKNGLKVYRVIEKWIDEYCKPKPKDLYGE